MKLDIFYPHSQLFIHYDWVFSQAIDVSKVMTSLGREYFFVVSGFPSILYLSRILLHFHFHHHLFYVTTRIQLLRI